jgi:4-amino-4-deoxy-L-arabinose transferase-like glycosyltransferase
MAGVNVALVWVLAAGAVVRLAVWAWAGGTPPVIADERDYDAIAVRLVERGEFALEGRLTSIRPPLYPAVVAGVYRLCGVGSYRAVHLLQAAVSLATTLLVYRLGTRLGSRRVATWAAGLYAFYPSLLLYNNLLLTEVLFTGLLTAACCVLARGYQRDSIADLGGGGVLLGLGALTRSVLWLFPPVLAVYLLATWRGPAGRRLTAALVMALGFAATIAPWAARNTRLQRTFITIDVMGGRNFMMGNYEYTPLHRAWTAIEIQGERSWIEVLRARHGGLSGLTQGQIDKLAQREAVRFVLGHPALTLRRDVIKFFNFWGLERELIAGAARGHFGRVPAPALAALTLLIFGGYAVTVVSAVFGAAVRPPADRRSHGLLLLFIAFVCGLHTLSFGHSRYHLPLIPLALVYSARAVADPRAIWSRRGTWAFGLDCALAGLLVAGWCWEVFAVDLDRFVSAVRAAA